MKIILLIYHDYMEDEVDTKSKYLMEEDEEDIKVYHFPEENASDFFEQRKKNSVDAVFYTKTISQENKALFSKKPYWGIEMS